jgi:hypothetical protein
VLGDVQRMAVEHGESAPEVTVEAVCAAAMSHRPRLRS